MKTFLKFFPAFIAAAFSLASCNNKEEIVPEVPQPPIPTHTVKFTSEVPETKTDMRIDGNTAVFSWTSDDIKHITVKENGIAGEITAQSGIVDGKLVIYATFPGESGDISKEYTAVLNGSVGNQTPRDASYDESADILIAKPIMGVPSDGIKFQFHRPVAINKMTLCNLPAGQTLKTVTIRSDKPLAGSIEGNDWDTESFGNSIVLSINRTVPANGELEVCYTSVPAENAVLTVDARVGTDSYLKTFGRGLTTTAGNVKIYSVGLVKQAHLTFVENFNAVGASTNKYGCQSELTTTGRADGFNFEWTAVGTSTKVYVFNNGVRLGTTNATGKIQNTTMLAPVPAGSTVYIKVYAARWGTDQGNIVLGYNGSEQSAAPASPAIESPNEREYSQNDFPTATEFSIVKEAGVNTFTISSSANRIIIDKLEVETYCANSGQAPYATVNTGSATNISQAKATLEGSYANATSTATATFFKWGTSQENLDKTLDATGNGGNFSATLINLDPETTYYYQAYASVNGTEIHTLESETFCGEVKSFTTSSSQSYSVNGWLELPAAFDKDAIRSTTTSSLNGLISHTHYFQGAAGTERNYTFLYDPETYASYWVAYPLAKGHTAEGRAESFGFDPDIDSNKQTNVTNGYGVNISTEHHPDNNHYARGHQIPNADRSANATAQSQTYYATNMTPQIQHGFNGGIWASLENEVRKAIPTSDTLYVVTGAAFRKVNGNESITTITNKNDSKVLPVPNYYWKVILKVKRIGKDITEALAIGFWLPHTDIAGENYTSYAVSVNEIEQFTGFDFFANLPDSLEPGAETNNNWNTFCSF